MKQSQLFTKTRKEAPADEQSLNAQLLVRAGFVHKEMAGVYAYLPLGIRVLEKIKKIIREEMDAVGGKELIMTSMQRKELWERTDRWDDENVDVWFKSALKNGADIGFAWSHEEPITDMMKNYIQSYKDLPVFVYQFQTKLRNELRAKSGIMRGREFVMKDLYSYCIDEQQHKSFYNSVIEAYLRVFERVELGDHTFLTFASGGAFTQFSHEFQTITEAGEDIVYLDRKKKLAINSEVLTDEVLNQLNVKREDLEEIKTSEVGNIFNFGTKKCEQLGLSFINEEGKEQFVHLGSYGIGITRLMGVIVEHFADERGMVWPVSVAPFDVHLISLCKDEAEKKQADELYEKLQTNGIDILYDDRDLRAGEKFADSDLIGIPKRIIISSKTLAENSVEVKMRDEEESVLVKIEDILRK